MYENVDTPRVSPRPRHVEVQHHVLVAAAGPEPVDGGAEGQHLGVREHARDGELQLAAHQEPQPQGGVGHVGHLPQVVHLLRHVRHIPHLLLGQVRLSIIDANMMVLLYIFGGLPSL